MIDQVWVQVGRGKIAETFEMWQLETYIRISMKQASILFTYDATKI